LKKNWENLKKVTGGLTDEELARMVISQPETCKEWMIEQGI
jgi:tricarballylate dehydrogenase